FRGHTAPKLDRTNRTATERVVGSEPFDHGKSADLFRPEVKSTDQELESIPDLSPLGSSLPERGPKVDRPGAAPSPSWAENSEAGLDAWRLADCGIEIPVSANTLEVDGVTISIRDPAGLAGRGSIPLVLPMGKHIVRFARTGPAQVIEPRR